VSNRVSLDDDMAAEPPPQAQAQAHGAALEEKLHDLESIQRATFNILEDSYLERERLHQTESAVFNILEDFGVERARLEEMQRATMNLLGDVAEEKERMEGTQNATFNILEDFAFEKERLEETQRASYNILEDFVAEREKLENLQSAAFNILEDLNSQRDVLSTEVTERARAENELENTNRELEAFSYSVSHDLRAPLRGIDGFSHVLLKEYGDKLDDLGREYLTHVRNSSQQMAQLIDDLLNLSRMSRGALHREDTNLAELARSVLETLKAASEARSVEILSPKDLQGRCDPRLIKVVLENLLGNAWKFTSRKEHATIEIGSQPIDGVVTYFIRDNGAGFDMAYADKLFGAFQRLHTADEFPGTGIGLATVRRIIHRHGGKIWAEGYVGIGTTIYFTLVGSGAV
jgi:light-regulated signal transduction histidine kinase (bacteriophytochrome)